MTNATIHQHENGETIGRATVGKGWPLPPWFKTRVQIAIDEAKGLLADAPAPAMVEIETDLIGKQAARKRAKR